MPGVVYPGILGFFAKPLLLDPVLQLLNGLFVKVYFLNLSAALAVDFFEGIRFYPSACLLEFTG